jgi:hypothetical protein
LNALFGGVKHPGPTVTDAATKAKSLICKYFVGSGSVTPPLNFFSKVSPKNEKNKNSHPDFIAQNERLSFQPKNQGNFMVKRFFGRRGRQPSRFSILAVICKPGGTAGTLSKKQIFNIISKLIQEIYINFIF